MKKLRIRMLAYSLSLYQRFLESRPIRQLLIWSKRLVIPGFDGVPLYDVTDFFIKGIQRGSITNRAAALSFNTFLAIFPAIIFFFTLIPYIPINNFQDSLLDLMQEFIPQQVYLTVEETLFDIVKRPRGSLLSVGFLLAMYFATNSINSLIEAFNHTYHATDTRSAFKQRLISIALVLILSVLVIIAIALITIGPVVIAWLKTHNLLTDGLTIFVLSTGKWIITLALLFFAFSFLYYIAPSGKQNFRFISAGSTITTLLFIAASIGFNYYVNNFSKYNSLYGSIGTLIVFMMWIYFNAIIILLGFELNASISVARKKQYTRQGRTKASSKKINKNIT